MKITEIRTYLMQVGGPLAGPRPDGSIGGATGDFRGSRNWLFVNTNNTPGITKLVRRPDGGYSPSGYPYLLDDQGYPGIKPPWGQLTAIDLNTGEFAWQVTLGEFPELKAQGVPQTGTENFGGPLVTAGRAIGS